MIWMQCTLYVLSCTYVQPSACYGRFSKPCLYPLSFTLYLSLFPKARFAQLRHVEPVNRNFFVDRIGSLLPFLLLFVFTYPK